MQENNDRFEIKDLSSLTWAMRKLSEIKSKQRENEVIAAQEIERINNWLVEVNKPYDSEIQFFESMIIHYHRQVLENNPKEKTLSTPYGKVRSRKTSETVSKSDDKKLLAYVLDNDLECYKPSLNWSELKKRLVVADGRVIDKETGEVVEGATVKPESVNYTVEVTE